MYSINKSWNPGNGEDLSAIYDQDTVSRSPSITAPESPAALLLTQDLIGMVDYSFIKRKKR
jgi:hypothetical protein